jgi:hypothetical protein
MKAYNVKSKLDIGNILIIGEASHGKDTVCDHLMEKFKVKSYGSSWYAACHFMVEAFKEKKGIHYDSPKACYEDRDNHRMFWFKEIEAFNAKTGCELAGHIFNEGSVYNGMRSYELEFKACKRAGIFDLIIYVDATERLIAEGKYKPDESMKIPKSEADIVIENNGTMAELFAKVDALMKAMKVGELVPLDRVNITDEVIEISGSSTSFANERKLNPDDYDMTKILARRKELTTMAKEKGIAVKRSRDESDKRWESLRVAVDEAVSSHNVKFESLKRGWECKLEAGLRCGYSDDLEMEYLNNIRNEMNALQYRNTPLGQVQALVSRLNDVEATLNSSGTFESISF